MPSSKTEPPFGRDWPTMGREVFGRRRVLENVLESMLGPLDKFERLRHLNLMQHGLIA